MASITSLGIGSGLDLNSLLSQLVAAERAPTQGRIDRKEASALGKLSGLGAIKSALAGFQSALESLKELATFQGRTAVSANADVFTVTADSTAIAARYAVEVVALASEHKLRSTAYAAADTVVGNGTLTLSSGAESFAVEIISGTDTLSDIVSAINEAPGNTTVLATIVNSVDGAHLVLTSAAAGSSSAITILASGGDGGLDNLIYDPLGGTTNLTQVTAAADGSLVIDGLVVTSTSNVIGAAIEGVTIDVLTAEPGTTYDLTIGYDAAAARAQLGTFVQSYNSLSATLSAQTSFDVETLRSGPLLGESAVRSVANQIRIAIGGFAEGVTGVFRSLADIGITTDLDGALVIDNAVLDTALDENFDAVGRLFSNEGGFATVLDTLVSGFLDSTGRLETRSDGLKTLIEGLTDQRKALDRRMIVVEARLRTQFTALDSFLSQLDSTSLFLTQQLTNLPGFTFNRNR